MLMNQQLVNYIKEAHTHGMTDEDIRRELASAGWQTGDIDAAFAIESPQAPSPLTAEQQIYINRPSVGALGLYWIYLLANGLYKRALIYWLLGIIPIVNIVFFIKLILRARAISWSERAWQSFDVYRKRQKSLDIVGTLVFILWFGMIIYAIFILFSQTKQIRESLHSVAPVSSEDCQSIGDDFIRNNCYRNLAATTKDFSYCEKMRGEGLIETDKANCYALKVAVTKDILSCQPIFGSEAIYSTICVSSAANNFGTYNTNLTDCDIFLHPPQQLLDIVRDKLSWTGDNLKTVENQWRDACRSSIQKAATSKTPNY